MVEVINQTIYSSKGSLAPKGAVIHNDAGSVNATAKYYVGWLPGHAPELGFAHYYIDRNTIFRAMDTNKLAWHCGNSWGNGNLLSYEVCQSGGDGINGASDKDFLANEEMTFKQVAEDFKFYGLTPSRDTIYLHRALSSTSCPWRSWQLHVGAGAPDTVANRNKLVDYFVARVKAHMAGNAGSTPTPTPTPTPKPTPTPTPQYKVEAWNVRQTVDVNGLRVRTSPNTTAKVINTLNAGQTFNATKICRNGENVNGYSTWFEVNGAGWVSGAYVTPISGSSASSNVNSNLKGANLPNSGYYAVTTTTNIRSGAGTNHSIVGTYATGQGFNYDSKVVAGGYVWLSYISYSGQRRYVAVV